MARGGRPLGDLLIHAYRKGCRLDGWSDQFRFDLWMASIRELGVDAEAIVHQPRGEDAVFPWDHIDMKVARTFLWEEWQKARRGAFTEDCRDGACQDCGVCDFTRVQPQVFNRDEDPEPVRGKKPTAANDFRQYKISFAKTDEGRFLGHLEMVNVFIRALRRAGITLKFSEGFHPKPKIVFDDALPIGIESMCESMRLTVADDIPADELVRRLNDELPSGLHVTDCHPYRKKAGNAASVVAYRVTLGGAILGPEAIQRFRAAESFIIERTSAKGKLKKIDLKVMIQHLHGVKPDTLELALLQSGGTVLRPEVILRHIFELSGEAIRSARVIKIGHREITGRRSPKTD